jgi:hypothetical protein
MLHEGEESSSRQLVHIEEQSFRGWGCSECAWLFHPYDPPVGKSLDEMKHWLPEHKLSEVVLQLLRQAELAGQARSTLCVPA